MKQPYLISCGMYLIVRYVLIAIILEQTLMGCDMGTWLSEVCHSREFQIFEVGIPKEFLGIRNSQGIPSKFRVLDCF
jgi:hypothetical protein